LASRDTLPAAFHHQWLTITQRLEAGVFDYLIFALTNARSIAIEVGLFAAPIAALWLLQGWSTRSGRRLSVVAVATVGTLLLAWRGHLVPYFSNQVLDVGCSMPRHSVGPLTLRDGCLSNEPGLGLVRFAPRVALTWIGLLGFGCAVVAAIEAWRAAPEPRTSEAQREVQVDDSRRATLALWLATAASYWIVVASIDVFDRYLLFLVPLAVALLGAAIPAEPRRANARAWIAAATLVLGSLLWSVGAVQEYLDWNRARWRAIAYLANDIGAGREEIDGGFEFGGWVNFDARFRHDRRGTSWWWVVDDHYAVAFAPIEGFVVLRRFPYRGWFGLVENDVVALASMTGARARQ
jgi:hypothetical protein